MILVLQQPPAIEVRRRFVRVLGGRWVEVVSVPPPTRCDCTDCRPLPLEPPTVPS